jgi:hypothetical protein
MNGGDWQLVVAVVIVAGAGTFLLRRLARMLTGKAGSGCGTGTCGICPTENAGQSAEQSLPLISLDVSAADVIHPKDSPPQ